MSASSLAISRGSALGRTELRDDPASLTAPAAGAPARLRLLPPSRDQQILALRAEGRSLAEIGRRFGVTRQRVDQIISRAGAAGMREAIEARRADARRERAELHAGRAAEQWEEIRELYRQGVDPQWIAWELELNGSAVKALIKRRRSDADRTARAKALPGVSEPRFSERELTDGVRLVAERLGRAPTGGEYDRLAQELGLACMTTVYMRFGGWRKALVAAGLEGVPASRAYATRWHVAACQRALESVADQLGDPPRYQRYAQLASERDDLPSAATLRVRLGLWSSIAALLMEQKARNGDRPTESPELPTANSRVSAELIARPSTNCHQPLDTVPTPNGTPNGTDDGKADRLPSQLGVRALQYLAEHPGSGGGAVKRGLDIRHDSQAWGLLMRLERDGLLVKQRNASACAWALTERGESVLRSLPEGVYA